MAKTTSKVSKTTDTEREGNRYTRAARVLAKDDTIDVKTVADRAFMSESTAARCLEAWQACVDALKGGGRLPDPAKAAAVAKKATIAAAVLAAVIGWGSMASPAQAQS
jgi:hypothetical protein